MTMTTTKETEVHEVHHVHGSGGGAGRKQQLAVSAELHARVKAHAALSGVKLSEFVEAALLAALAAAEADAAHGAEKVVPFEAAPVAAPTPAEQRSAARDADFGASLVRRAAVVDACATAEAKAMARALPQGSIDSLYAELHRHTWKLLDAEVRQSAATASVFEGGAK